MMQNSPRYLDMAGTIFTNIGLPAEALPLYQRADELQPGVDTIRANLAACCVYVGEVEEARRLYAELLQKYPDHQRNHYELSRLGRAKDDGHIMQMKAVLESTELEHSQNIYLYYALGKELEDLERWDEAFDFYKLAGDAASSLAVGTYDVSADVAVIDAIIETCDREWLGDKSVAKGGGEKAPVFVVGLPRTGTTLTERILSSHSQVGSAGESFFMQITLKKLSGVRTPDAMSPAIIKAAATKDAQRIADGYMQSIAYRLGDEPLFIEKLPENVLYLGFIAKAFPDARIVLLNRNPMDACFALYKQSYFRFAYTLDDLGAYYVAYHRLREHWRRTLGDRLVEVDYEGLVSDQQRRTEQLLSELGLEFEEACLNFQDNRSASNTASTVQIREKAHTRSVLRWKCYEKRLQSLVEHLERAGISVDEPVVTESVE